jgi:hypothetical protein
VSVPDSSQRSAWSRLATAGVLAGLGFLAASLQVYYLTRFAAPAGGRAPDGRLVEDILRVDLILIGLLIALTALAGSFLAERYGLAGLGSLRQLLPRLKWLLPAGAALGALSYLLFGRPLAARVPETYPCAVGWATVLLLKGALFDEVVARYGVMTILSGACRRPWLANLLQAGLFTALPLRGLRYFGRPVPGWSAAFAGSLAMAGLLNLIGGALFARLGLIAAQTFRLALDARYVPHALLCRR